MSNSLESNTKFIEQLEVDDWEVLTDDGWQEISFTNKTIPYKVYNIILEDGYELKCADRHILINQYNEEVFAIDSLYQYILTESGPKKVLEIQDLDYEDNMYDLSVESENHTYYTNGILSHNTTSTVAVLLWYVLFYDHYSIGILANKMTQAKEVLNRVKIAYENLPAWLQQGVDKWNESEIKLENGSSIRAAASSSSAIRGLSVTLLYLDEFAHINMRVQEEFFASTYPTISAGNETKIIITSTPFGMNLFYKIWKDAKDKKNLFSPIEAHWSEVPGRDEKWKKDTIRNMGEKKFREEFEADFIGSQATLISPQKLLQLRPSEPIRMNNELHIFKNPEPDRQYLAFADVSKGVERDYSIVTVIDATTAPYEVVAVFRSNTISPIHFPNYIYQLCTNYNDAWVLVETNKYDTVLHILQQDLEYENILRTTYNTQKKQKHISLSYGNPGVETDKKIKRIGCLTLKDLIEQEQLIINDDRIIDELCQFVEFRESYAADPDSDATDDIVMTLVLFSWVAADKMFKEFMDHNLRQKLLEHKDKMFENSLLPLPVSTNHRVDNDVPELSVDQFNKWMRDEFQTNNDNSGLIKHIYPVHRYPR